MEMEKVPVAGYSIIGLPVAGFHRKFTWRNFLFPFKLLASLVKARKIIKDFKPDLVLGFGGYASGPLLWSATSANIPILIQEQNSFAGITNKILSKKAGVICVAYDGMEKYFPANKIIHTGNPVRKDIIGVAEKKEIALRHFGLSGHKKTILAIGGSLGARTINLCLINGLEKIRENNIQLIWQAGRIYYDDYRLKLSPEQLEMTRMYPFIQEMDLAYAAADLVISRSGALSVSELCTAGKAALLIPSPNVAENHQVKNAENLLRHQAAEVVNDQEAPARLVNRSIELLRDYNRLLELEKNIKTLAQNNAAENIVNAALRLLK
jgi:UDP-N-acetylglucosamine--N-acetylmuramyl-(pentapeptide) pyrophosphoryl-undecaprenol N-acetylglucosamine transferase